MRDFLNLPNVTTTDVAETEGAYVIEARSTEPRFQTCRLFCPVRKNGKRVREINDTPIHGKPVLIRMQVPDPIFILSSTRSVTFVGLGVVFWSVRSAPSADALPTRDALTGVKFKPLFTLCRIRLSADGLKQSVAAIAREPIASLNMPV